MQTKLENCNLIVFRVQLQIFNLRIHANTNFKFKSTNLVSCFKRKNKSTKKYEKV